MTGIATNNVFEIRSVRRAALTAGLAILVMALTVPVVEFYIFPQLIDYKNPSRTVQHITNHPALFSFAIFVHFITVICDLVSAWALYIFLRPVNKELSLLTAWFRLVNTAFTIAALSNFVKIITLLSPVNGLTPVADDQLQHDVMVGIRSFNLQWRFMLIFFGVYMNLLGYLALKANYIPNVIAFCLIVTGLGYLVENLKYFFYPGLDTGFLWVTYFGELIFMFWLLLKGSRIKELEKQHSKSRHTAV